MQCHIPALMAVAFSQRSGFAPQRGIAQKQHWISEPKNISVHKQHRLVDCLSYNRGKFEACTGLSRVVLANSGKPADEAARELRRTVTP